MDKNSLLLSFYAGRKIDFSAFEKYFFPNGSSQTEYIHEILDEWDYVSYELIASIEKDVVVSVDVSKIEDLNTGHGRPHSIEKSLTSSEWKYAYQVFDECFPDQSENELNEIIQNALNKGVSYSGYTIKKELKNDIAFETADGNTVKLPKKRISQAIHYSHSNLNILFKPEVACEFANCFGKSPFEPLFAVLSVVKPETYPNYDNLLAKYRFEELIQAIDDGDLSRCRLFEDVLKNPQNDIGTVGNAVSYSNNSAIAEWFFMIVPDNSCVLNGMLYTAIKNSDSSTVNYILKKRLFNVSEKTTSWRSPMSAAIENPKFVPLLLENGFELASDDYFSTLSLDEIMNDLQYNVHFGEPVIDRILAEKRYDILQIIEDKAPNYCSEEILISAYVTANDFERFKNGINKGWFSKTTDYFGVSLFEKIYSAGEEWADFLIKNGFDVNQNSGRMLFKACRDLKTDYAIYLLKNGADPYLREEYSSTIFELAAGFHGYLNEEQQKQQEKLCNYLLDLDVDPIMESRSTPSIFTYLLNLSSEFKQYLIDWLGRHDRINAYECQNNREISKHSLLHRVLDPYSHDKFDSLVLKKMLDYGAKVNVAADSGDTLFLQACAVCGVEDLDLLIKHGANINELNEMTQTNGLFDAVWHQQSNDVIEYLISIGLDVNSTKQEVRMKNGYYGQEKVYPAQSVLDIAIEKGNQETIKLLKDYGAKTAAEMEG